MKKDKKKFIRRSICFMAMLIIVAAAFCALPFYVFISSKEFYLIDEVILRQQTGENILFGPAYSNPDKYFKLQSLNYRKNDVLVLGTSRVMQFRKGSAQNGTFYNAGAIISRISHLNYILYKIPDNRKPEIIIVGLDQYFFNPNWDNGFEENPDLLFSKNENNLMRFRDNMVKAYLDIIQGKIDFKELKKPNKIGLNAMIKNQGFRNDGSFDYWNTVLSGGINNPSYYDYLFKNIRNRIEQGANRFQYGQEISSYSIEELEKFLNTSRSKSIHVIGFLPPYATEIWEEMMARNDDYAYMTRLNSTLAPIFQKYGFAFYDFSNLSSIGADECEVLDGFHGSEKAYSRIMLRMAQEDKKLGKFVNTTKLESGISKSDNCFQIGKISK